MTRIETGQRLHTIGQEKGSPELSLVISVAILMNGKVGDSDDSVPWHCVHSEKSLQRKRVCWVLLLWPHLLASS
jgi:hypothetical protein